MYVHEFSCCNGIEKAKRIGIVNSSQVGRYSYLSSDILPNKSYIELAHDLPTYILKMLAFGLG